MAAERDARRRARHDSPGAGPHRRGAAAIRGGHALDPHAGIVANNLALIYMSDARLDDALRLARIAQASAPSRPEMNDTLGWIT